MEPPAPHSAQEMCALAYVCVATIAIAVQVTEVRAILELHRLAAGRRSGPINSPALWEEWLQDILAHPEENPNDPDVRERLRMSKIAFAELHARLAPLPYFANLGVRRRGNPGYSLALLMAVALYRIGHQAITVPGVACVFGVSNGYVVSATSLFMDAVSAALFNEEVRWPLAQERATIAARFAENPKNQGRIPHVIGAIDGTHIILDDAQVSRDSQIRKDYTDRHDRLSLLVQAVVDDEGLFRHVAGGVTGSWHDSRLLANSAIGREPRRFIAPGEYLVGDTGYACLPWLLTPFKLPELTSLARRRYNKCISSMRVTVENAFGRLKSRFPLLRLYNMDVNSAEQVIKACCALHNFVQRRDGPWEDPEPDEELENIPYANLRVSPTGAALRNRLVALF